MKTAMVLAAGKGVRMRPLTDNLPKALLPAGGRPLLQYHLENLARAGVDRIVINYARFGKMIVDRFGNGRAFGVDIVYSAEGDEPLETGGGIKKALPLLGPDAFIVVNADVWTDYDFKRLPPAPAGLAHLVLVPNPNHHKQGDFTLDNDKVADGTELRFTYSGIGVYKPEFFSGCTEETFSLAPLLRAAAGGGAISGEIYNGLWMDIGTPERLHQLDEMLAGGGKFD